MAQAPDRPLVLVVDDDGQIRSALLGLFEILEVPAVTATLGPRTSRRLVTTS
jgi:FixJ family two-component response regulator